MVRLGLLLCKFGLCYTYIGTLGSSGRTRFRVLFVFSCVGVMTRYFNSFLRMNALSCNYRTWITHELANAVSALALSLAVHFFLVYGKQYSWLILSTVRMISIQQLSHPVLCLSIKTRYLRDQLSTQFHTKAIFFVDGSSPNIAEIRTSAWGY